MLRIAYISYLLMRKFRGELFLQSRRQIIKILQQKGIFKIINDNESSHQAKRILGNILSQIDRRVFLSALFIITN